MSEPQRQRRLGAVQGTAERARPGPDLAMRAVHDRHIAASLADKEKSAVDDLQETTQRTTGCRRPLRCHRPRP